MLLLVLQSSLGFARPQNTLAHIGGQIYTTQVVHGLSNLEETNVEYLTTIRVTTNLNDATMLEMAVA